MNKLASVVAVLSLGPACGDDGASSRTDTSGGTTDTGVDTSTTTITTTLTTSSTTLTTSSNTGTETTGEQTTTGMTTTGVDDSTGGSETSGAMCGDGVADRGEACDNDDLAGEDCTTQGFDGGELACAADCTFDATGCIVFSCGNDTVEGNEVCDGTDLAGEDCSSQGFEGGTLSCAAGCAAFDTTLCDICGNDEIEGVEVCDGADLGGETCLSQGFTAGMLECAADCMSLDTAQCTDALVVCSTPNAAIANDLPPVVDTVDVVLPADTFVADVNVSVDAAHTFVGDLLVSVRHVQTDTPVLLADDICGTAEDIDATFDQDAAAAPDCVAPIAIEGNVLPMESLDQFVGLPDTAGNTWELTVADLAVGDDGMLTQWCMVIETTDADPVTCGDDITAFGEVCDGTDLAGTSCVEFGYNAGTLACEASCQAFDTSGCTSVCGDQDVEPDEDCDTQEIAATTCEDLGFGGGSLDCDASCVFDTTQCSNTVIAACASPGVPIDDSMPVSSIVNLTDVGTVADVDVFTDITHTFTADLDIVLRHVATNTIVDLTSDQCGGDDDVFAFFNDEAAALPDCFEPVGIEGNVLPESPLSGMDGLQIAGDWEIVVTDDSGGDSGTFNEWCIYVTAN
jgi:subtilisin-like proprotein convertase family protein